ncbi:hypothetical protein BHE74_00021193 [Ensete ventricosum]|nr:hypothetical protein GW17_00040154 [Ensete ventricosum]RWW71088.1 hypothetical protein BHE74_00021193 [Ensete ventricosum]RZR90335.1 hypothetical protein BHM03_00018194 [Ensete ventricosum]
MTSLPNPKFSQRRLALTKVIAFVYLVDDIFDLNGSLDEVRLFTDAINNYNEEHKLPILEEHVTVLLFEGPNLKA